MKTVRSGFGSLSMLMSRRKKLGVVGPRSAFDQRPNVVIVWTSRPPGPWPWVACLMSSGPRVSLRSRNGVKLALAVPAQARAAARATTRTIVRPGRIAASPVAASYERRL
jgi:hypothetical protein